MDPGGSPGLQNQRRALRVRGGFDSHTPPPLSSARSQCWGDDSAPAEPTRWALAGAGRRIPGLTAAGYCWGRAVPADARTAAVAADTSGSAAGTPAREFSCHCPSADLPAAPEHTGPHSYRADTPADSR